MRNIKYVILITIACHDLIKTNGWYFEKNTIHYNDRPDLLGDKEEATINDRVFVIVSQHLMYTIL